MEEKGEAYYKFHVLLIQQIHKYCQHSYNVVIPRSTTLTLLSDFPTTNFPMKPSKGNKTSILRKAEMHLIYDNLIVCWSNPSICR